MNLDRFQNVRWVAGGRDYPHLDCYGVINEVRRALDQPLWPEYAGITKEHGGLASAAAAHARQATPCDAKPGAVAFCYEAGAVSHVAVVIELDGRLHALECNPRRNVTVLPLPRFCRRFIRVEFYW